MIFRKRVWPCFLIGEVGGMSKRPKKLKKQSDSFHETSAASPAGRVGMDRFAGQVVLVVNVASK